MIWNQTSMGQMFTFLWKSQQPAYFKSAREEPPAPLKLFSVDQLQQLARDLAGRHRVSLEPVKDQLLLRLDDNEKILLKAHEQLSAAGRERKRISPAGEWLLDNFHAIEEQIRTAKTHLPKSYSKELPHLINSPAQGYPRVYHIALEIIAHVDGRVDLENITSFIAAYQEVAPLKLGEFWAIPIMLRLALIENIRRVTVRVLAGMHDRANAKQWANQMIEFAENDPKNLILIAADLSRSKPILSNAFVAEFVMCLQGLGTALEIPLNWIELQLIEFGSNIQQTVKIESKQQASNQVSVGASISSLRVLGAIDWNNFVESLSVVELHLRRDPSRIYTTMDFATRDRYRHAVENLAKRSGWTEIEVAKKAIELAESPTSGRSSQDQSHHVGYFLVDKGRHRLESELGLTRLFSPSMSQKRNLLGITYSISVIALSLLVTFYIVSHTPFSASTPSKILVGLLCFICASQVAIALVNWFSMLLIKPELLPKLDFSKGIPASCQTLVIIPSLLTTMQQLEELLNHLEVRFLANRDSMLSFGLLTDFTDAASEHMPDDEVLLNSARQGIADLNEKYKTNETDIFFLFHRSREWNPRESTWMGYERKRGKIAALNALLRGGSTSRNGSLFSTVVGDIKRLQNVKYVITLDSDTQLPRDAARKLIGTMAHPLNQPVYDIKTGIVRSGYTILQPRVANSLKGSQRSWFARLYAGDSGIDPYTRAVSDVYQDIFQEGSFIGKGIYQVDNFSKTLDSAFPENLILSHDLLEGCYARCGLVSDVLLYEEQPFHYGVEAKRRHRWIRGDWQIACWLLPRTPDRNWKFGKNPVSWLSKWKIFDNLRRSLVPVATLLLLLTSWIDWSSFGNSWFLTKSVLFMIFLPPLLTSLADLTRKPARVSPQLTLHSVWGKLSRQMAQGFFDLILLPQEAFNSLDAIGKSLYRMLVSRKYLLVWKSATDPQNSVTGSLSSFYKTMAFSYILALLVLLGLAIESHSRILPALPFLLLWGFSPIAVFWMSQVIKDPEAILEPSHIQYLNRLARKTWRFFETFSTLEDNWLPPDNYQEYPAAIVAHRTSPTNIGMSLLAHLSAKDFGYISASKLVKRTTQVFSTLEKLERYRGHFYNWYDTVSLKPLPPLYVSTVDSGNFVGALITLKAGLNELADQPILSSQAAAGLKVTYHMIQEAAHEGPNFSDHTSQKLSYIGFLDLLDGLDAPFQNLWELKNFQKLLQQVNTDAQIIGTTPDNQELSWWIQAFQDECLDHFSSGLSILAPLLELPEPPESLWKVPQFPQFEDLLNELNLLLQLWNRIPTFREIAQSEQKGLSLLDELLVRLREHDTECHWLEQMRQCLQTSSREAREFIVTIEGQSLQCDEFGAIEYDFLYDKSRRLLSIGYNASEHRRDASYYDLLASEARLGSFIAIAQDHLPQEHWFVLGRLLTSWNRKSGLLSWNGSMFEYLMPLLIMPTFKNTLLDQTFQTVIDRQIAYGRDHGIPWGVSESGYNTTDTHLNYQYRAFGVPGLGFKRGLEDDLVIAPYASVMALMVSPKKALTNLQNMSRHGFEGRYGFYEAIDYTPARLAPDQKFAIVRSFMAHHQGMSFLSLAYLLLDRKMQKRFSSDLQMKATELLLYERVPKTEIFHPHAPTLVEPSRFPEDRETMLRVIDTPQTPRPEVHFLSNGRYSLMISNAGGGYSRWKDIALTRWREDPTCDNWGSFCYIRDLGRNEIWSAGFHPTLKKSQHYEAIFSQAKAEFRRRDHELEMHTEITVSPEDDIELRRFSITNLSAEIRTIELTTYAEVVLTLPSSDDSHPAFSKLFVQTEIIHNKQAILCHRRPRSDQEKNPTMFHLMSVREGMAGEVSYETDRKRFIGRGRDPARALAMEFQPTDSAEPYKLSGQSGSVLDPIVAIRCRLVLKPEQTVHVHVVTGVGETREEALALIEEYQDRHLADRVFDLAWTHRQVVLRQLNITETDARLFARLASSLVYANLMRRAKPSILSKNRRGQSGLWGSGISGDLPIVLLRIGNQEKIDLVRQLLRAHAYWRLMGLSVDLVIWNEDASGYLQQLNTQIVDMIAGAADSHQMDKEGGIFLRRPDQMAEDERILLQTVARVIIQDDRGSFMDQIDRRDRISKQIPLLIPTRDVKPIDLSLEHYARTPDNLRFKNGYGGFSKDGCEYIISSSIQSHTPAPWSNVIANQYFGTVVSEAGSAYTWCENAHEYRLTPWYNDALSDPSGEAFYIRDDATGQFWSPTPLPSPSPSPYVTRHGFGYSSFSNASYGLSSELKVSVALDAPVKITLIALTNTSSQTRHISITGYCEWVLSDLRAKSLMHIVSECDPGTNALFASNPFHPDFGRRIGFFDVSESSRTYTCDRSEFLGRNGRLAQPQALYRTNLSGKVGAGLDSCSALQTSLELAPGESYELVFVLGVGRDVDDVRTLIRRFCDVNQAHKALSQVEKHWQFTLGAVQVKTPDESINILANGWLLYQILSSRVWGRSGSYQSGGAFGFRDQLQDTMALLHAEPKILREHLIRCAGRQYRDGDVQHWWHPPSGRGVRTHCSDDYLWLPLATSRYVLGIGDTGVLDVRINFLDGRQVKPEEEAYMDLPTISDESGTLYEHCVRAIKHGFRYGVHGLPLIGGGDWNDGMNLVGEHGKGESVWMGFFLIHVLKEFSKIATLQGDRDFVQICQRESQALQHNLELHAWDGQWYKRGFFDSGEPLGSAKCLENQIDSLPQSWSVLSGVGETQKTQEAMNSLESRLVDRDHCLIKLLTPPFDKKGPNPGYIRGYVPGVRENGGQYTHAAIWAIMAFAKLGRVDEAWDLLHMINPINLASNHKKADVYQVEPYVIAADVYASPDHIGRGGWTWYTGAAAWMYRLILESLLGLRLEVDRLHFSPQLPEDWQEFQVHYRFRDTQYDIQVKVKHANIEAVEVNLDGKKQLGEGLQLLDDKMPHKVEVTLFRKLTKI